MASYRWRSRVVRRADLSPAKKPSNSSAKFARDLERAFPSAGESPSQLSDNFERTLSWAAADLHGCRRRQRADSVPVAREHLSLHHFRVSQRLLSMGAGTTRTSIVSSTRPARSRVW